MGSVLLCGTAAAATDPDFELQWGLQNAGQTIRGLAGTPGADGDVASAWNTVVGSHRLTVAVIDTGVAFNHPDLRGAIATNPGEMGGGRETNGIDDDGNGFVDDVHGWDFLSYAAAMGAKIVVLSLAGRTYSPEIEAAIEAHPEMLFFTPAGNQAQDVDTGDQYFPCTSPAANLVCVAATDELDQLAGFSDFGATSVDLAAPGADTYTTQPKQQSVFADSFEKHVDGRWTTGGAGAAWSRTEEQASNGAWSLTDSPAAPYPPNAANYAQAGPFDLSTMQGCSLTFRLNLDAQADGDGVAVEASGDGASWRTLASYTGSTDGYVDKAVPLLEYDHTPILDLRLAFTSNDTAAGDGAHVDRLNLSCLGRGGDRLTSYGWVSGTSMATPVVAGAAALVWSQDPAATAAEVRSALLSTTVPLPSLQGTTVTGGRLDAAAAVAAVPDQAAPDTTITAGPTFTSALDSPSFAFRSTESPSTFQCRIDAQAWQACVSPQLYLAVQPGSHVFQVRARDTAGNVDPTPARRTFTVQPLTAG